MDFLGPFMPILLMIPIFYFLILRPEQMKRKKHQNMLENLAKGDEVVTTGGLHGKIVGVNKDIVVMTIAENVKVEVSRSAIAFVKKGGHLIEGE
jgi:preprotein translocase subunit YajC